MFWNKKNKLTGTTGERIKQARHNKKMTQWELAEACGYSDNTTLTKIEHDRSEPTISRIYKMSVVLGVSPNELINWEDFK